MEAFEGANDNSAKRQETPAFRVLESGSSSADEMLMQKITDSAAERIDRLGELKDAEVLLTEATAIAKRLKEVVMSPQFAALDESVRHAALAPLDNFIEYAGKAGANAELAIGELRKAATDSLFALSKAALGSTEKAA